jgi:hypothetical protein
MTSKQTSSHSPGVLRGLTRDFTTALGQQMFFWGRDVIHPRGNLLCEHGFDRRPSTGLEGTSCYRKEIDGGEIELHGACVGWYPNSRETAGFLFIRNRRRCFCYTGGEPPAPGVYQSDHLHPGPAADLFALSQQFLEWWLAYEDWISTVTGTGYRDACYRAFRKLPKSDPWLPPDEGIDWLRTYHHEPGSLKRARIRRR